MYKTVYKNIIKNGEYLNEKIKKMYEADIKIKTNYIDPRPEYSEEIKKRFKRQWANLRVIEGERNNG